MEYVPGCDLEQVWRELAGVDGQGDPSALSSSTWNRAVHSASQKRRAQTGRGAQRGTSASDAVNVTVPPLPLPPLPDLPSVPDDPGGYTRRVAMLIRDAALALQTVHDQGAVHRDVKPANLMLTPDGSRVVLMDFGLAKSLSYNLTSQHMGGLLGTLRYAAPEQLAAASLKVGPPADVRGLGVVLWEMLTRRRLFADAADEVALSERIFHRDVPNLRSVAPGFDSDIEAIVAKATARDTAERTATTRELASHLQLYLDGEPLPIRMPTRAERFRRWVRSHRVLAWTSATAAALVLLFSALAFWMTRGSSLEQRRAAQSEADTFLDRGLAAVDHDTSVALLWSARALESAPADDVVRQRAIRTALTGLAPSSSPPGR